ncbi:pilus assembly protein PilP [Veronia nyctiphanis]|uniref:Pilus assembly protein PilP n=1 Tax=Veronia nyctiphanis TaxID=1278244 RepID=A0A4Q0YTG3_9GAMM|nr:pilus assembly protein PilP [Veronia nyctiphanis]RXJ73454.1 pilus assembly protein PilP [Veronia nyctiphanis]
MKFKHVVVTSLIAGLAGCHTSNDSDLDAFITQTKASAKITATQVPELPRYQAVAFVPSGKNQPFALGGELDADTGGKNVIDCWQPDYNNESYPLARYDVTSLTFKGVMGQANALFALIETPEGQIETARIGDILGNNHGRIARVGKAELELVEQLSDGRGCWQSRTTKLALN